MPATLNDWLALLERRHPVSIDLGLERCRQVWVRMNSPRPAQRIVTVAGTNGKGSTVAYLDAILRALGFSVGRYTSPHLLRFNERLVVDGQELADASWITALDSVDAARQGVSLTYFEHTTLAAFAMMHQAQLDFAVLEIGLGGRLDTVNLVDPDCVVLTPIGLDHQQYLGNDRESIGREKAGTFRHGVPVVIADRNPPHSVLEKAADLEVPLARLGIDFEHDDHDGRAWFDSGALRIEMPTPGLAGAHQRDNLAAVLAAMAFLVPGRLQSDTHWQAAVSALTIPGRLTQHASDARVVIDVGHNPDAARVVAHHLGASCRGRVHCVLGMLADKDAAEVARMLSPVVMRWYAATLGGARGRDAEALSRSLRRAVPGIMVAPYADVATALRAAQQAASRQDTILVFGSFETAAAAFRELDADRVGG